MNRSITLFLFDNERHIFIKKHQFLVQQSKSRILSNFNNLEKEADALRDMLLQGDLYSSNPKYYYDDESALYEDACSEAYSQYNLLKEMKREVELNSIAHLYHNWEKTLRSWLLREMTSCWKIENIECEIWQADIGKIYNLLDYFGFNTKLNSYFQYLDALRLIVNVYKHGNGSSLSQLETKYPQYLNADFSERGFLSLHDEYSRLKITEEHFEKIAQAITSFWENLPKQLFAGSVDNIMQIFSKKAQVKCK